MQCRRHRRRGFNPWIGKSPWRRAWQPTLVFLPGESHGQRSLTVYSPWGRTDSDTTGVIEPKIVLRSWQGMREKTQEEEKPEETAELKAVITRQRQEKIEWKRQQSQKHKRGHWKMFSWKPDEEFHIAQLCRLYPVHQEIKLTQPSKSVQSDHFSLLSSPPGLIQTLSPPASDWCSHPASTCIPAVFSGQHSNPSETFQMAGRSHQSSSQ